MAAETAIEWTDATWNPIRGCTRLSPGCGGGTPGDLKGGCYAERVAARFSGPGQAYEGLAEMRNGAARWTGKLRLVEEALTQPLRWKRPRRIFVNSMSDLFHEVLTDEQIDRVFAVMALAPQHTFQVLTKRSARMRAYMTDTSQRRSDGLGTAVVALDPTMPLECLRWPLPNVWLGVSAEDQTRADERVPDLLATPAATRFVSAEPLLGPIDFGLHRVDGIAVDPLCDDCGERHEGACDALDWIIVGGESGPGARPMHPHWARDIRDACAAAGVAFFHKQNGAWAALKESEGEWPVDADGFIRLGYDGTRHATGWPMQRVGKKFAGRLLDGVTHDAMPEVRHG